MSPSTEQPPSVDKIGANLGAIDIARTFDSGPFGYVTAGQNDIIDGMNTTLSEWLGGDSATIIGRRTIQDLLAPGDRIYYDTHIRPMLVMHHAVTEIAVQLMCADGSRLPVLMNSVLRVDEGGQQRWEAVLIDVTERRRYEEELVRERRSAEHSEARLQVMYDVVSGLAGATSVDEIAAVVTERGERSIAGASCSVWIFGDDLRSVARASGRGVAHTPHDLAGGGPALVELTDGNLLMIDDVEQSCGHYPILCEMLKEAGHASAVVAPLVTHGVLLGVINYGFDEPHEFTEYERRAVVSLAEQTEQALQRAGSIQAERRSRRRMESLFRFTTRLAAALTVDDVLAVIAGDSLDLLGASDVQLAVLAEDQASVRLVHTTDQDAEGTASDLDAKSIHCAVIRTGDAVVVESRTDLRQHYPDSQFLEGSGLGRTVALPLVGDGVLGAWVLSFAESGPPDADDLTLLHLFAEQAGQATRRAFFHHAEAAARARADVRLAIFESLNAAATIEEVAQAITIPGRKAFGASHLAVYVADGGTSKQLGLIASVGFEVGEPLSVVAELQADFVLAAVTESSAPVHVVGAALASLCDGPFAHHAWAAVVLVPISVSGDFMGLVVVGFDGSDVVTPGTRAALAGLSAEAGAALGRAQRFELDHEVATTLQESLLPTDLGTLEGFSVSARYAPGSKHLVVGGDLFDVIRTKDDRILVVVGDVVGHGLNAAASMGQLRSAARALALVCPGPLEILQGLEQFAQITPGAKWATVACISIEQSGDGLYACAGHPYPILVRNGGVCEMLEGGRSALLGLNADAPNVARFHMDEGNCLVLYTDGLIEVDGEHIDDGIQRLQRTLSHAHQTNDMINADHVVDSVLGSSESRDDVVVVCVSRVATDQERRLAS